jgi:hypothetical protein
MFEKQLLLEMSAASRKYRTTDNKANEIPLKANEIPPSQGEN